MKLKWKLAIGIPVALAVAGGVFWFAVPNSRFWVWVAYQTIRPVPHRCKQRSADFQARVERIRADAKASLRIGTKKADVIRFFAAEKIPMDSYRMAGQNVVQGQIYVTGLPECATVACGDDSAMIGVRVDVDENGSVVSEPVVIGMYTDCL